MDGTTLFPCPRDEKQRECIGRCSSRNLLLADENLAELEPLLEPLFAFLPTFILESEIVRRIMR